MKLKPILVLGALLFSVVAKAVCSIHEDGCCNSDDTAHSVKFNCLDTDKGKQILGGQDSYTAQLSAFDLKMYLGRDNASEADYRKFVAEQVCEWNDVTRSLLADMAQRLNKKIKAKGLNLKIPKEGMSIVLTTMKEAGGAAGYTRGTTIVLYKDLLEKYKKEGLDDNLEELMAHEMFHILTRVNSDFRKEMYSQIGFTVMPKPVNIPDGLKDKVISNPDVNAHDSYATFTVNGRKADCAIIIYSDTPYIGGSLFKYIKIGLLEINPETSEPLYVDGKYQLHDITEASDFYDKVGRNTGYVIDPEEALADNFVIVVTKNDYSKYKTPDLLKRVEAVCK